MIEITGEGKSAVATPDGKKPKEEEEVVVEEPSITAFVSRPSATYSDNSTFVKIYDILWTR